MSASSLPFARIGIVGLGLIGGSIAMAVRRGWPSVAVIGVDCSEEAVRQALDRGLTDRGSTDLAEMHGADLVVLAAPVRENLAALSSVNLHLAPNAVVTDVGSTKRAIVDAARALKMGPVFVGGHPLAGAASGGLAYARADLFAGRPWVLTPEAGTPGDGLARLHALIGALGATPVTMNAEDHDRVMAAVSHLPQLAASALMHVAAELAGDEGLAMSGAGLFDTTRLASSPAAMWRDICATNADHLRPALERLVGVLADLAAGLDDGEALDRVFGSAGLARRRLEECRGRV